MQRVFISRASRGNLHPDEKCCVIVAGMSAEIQVMLESKHLWRKIPMSEVDSYVTRNLISLT